MHRRRKSWWQRIKARFTRDRLPCRYGCGRTFGGKEKELAEVLHQHYCDYNPNWRKSE